MHPGLLWLDVQVQVAFNYLEYKSAYLGVANSSQGRLASVTVFQQKGERNGNGSVPTRAGPRKKLFII